jgi:hypothetical protein
VPESLPIPRDAIAPRPDPEALLRAAIRERDATTAARLVQQWVHRRGLNDLERFQQELVLREDPEAGFWLRQQWEEPHAAPTTPTLHASPTPEAPEAPSPPSLTESFTEPLSEELRLLLATPLEDPFGEPAPRLAREATPITTDPLPFDLQMGEPLVSSEQSERPVDQAPLVGEEASAPPARRGTLSRIKARMRGYMEEAMDALHRTPPLADPAAAELSEPPVREEKTAVAAPSPTTLADLRAWLPDAADDVRRAS